MTIQAFGSAFSNGVMLALPLLLWLYGDQGGVPALLIITLDVIVFSSVTVLLEIGRGSGGGRSNWRIGLQAARAVAPTRSHGHRPSASSGASRASPLPAVVASDPDLHRPGGAPSALFALGATPVAASRRLARPASVPASAGPGSIASSSFLHDRCSRCHHRFAWLLPTGSDAPDLGRLRQSGRA